MKIGYFLSSEEHGPNELVRQAQLAEQAGFDSLWISDHFHPWNDEQGESPFVWSVIGAIGATTSLPVTTAVTCPTVRTHPLIIAQAAATSALMCHGKFQLGVGSGEALNEHVLGDPWPNASKRLDMLREAVEVIRLMFDNEVVSFDGTYYTVDDARLYSRPERRVPIYVSGFGNKAIDLAAEIGDGFISTKLRPDDVKRYRAHGGRGPAQGGYKVCWAPTEDEGVKTAHQLWAHSQLGGELSQVLPSPKHFEQAAENADIESTRANVVCGPDVERHIQRMRDYFEAGYDEVFVSQMGHDQERFFDVYAKEVLPAVRSS